MRIIMEKKEGSYILPISIWQITL